MTTTVQLYPANYPETTGSLWFDLNDPSGTNAGDTGYTATYIKGDIDTGSPAWEFERFNPPQRDGGSTTYKRGGFRTMSLPVTIKASSYDNYATAVGRIQQWCQTGGTLLLLPDGSSNTRYYDVEPSPTPFYFDGRALSLFEAIRLFGLGNGITLQLTAQPYARGAELDSSSNILTNATLLIDENADGTPTNWVWDSTTNITTQNIDAAAQAFEFTIATTGTRNLQQTTANSSVTGGSNYITAVYAQASAGSIARITVGFQGKNNAGTNQGAESTSTQTTLTTAWQQIAVSAAANASATKTQISLRMANAAATSVDVRLRLVQCKLESAISPFMVGSETGSVDPANYGGHVFPVYNPGDAPMPLKVQLANTSIASSWAWMSRVASMPGASTLTSYLNSGHVSQFEDWTNGTDTVVNTSANSSPGTGNTGKKTTFVTTTTQSRATLSITSSATLSMLQGRSWYPTLRMAAADATYIGQFYLVLKWGSGSDSMFYYYYPTGTNTTFVVSGYYHIAGSTQSPSPVTFPDVLPDSLALSLFASRASGTGNIIWDFIEWVPAENLTLMEPVTGAISTSDAIRTLPLDSRAVVLSGSTGALTSVIPTVKGAVPMVVPPGLSILYASIGPSASNTDETLGRTRTDTRTAVNTARFLGAPRYL